MSGAEIAGFVAALLLMAAGVAGSLLPGIPGTPIMFLVAAAYRVLFGPAGLSDAGLAVLLGLTVLSIALDYLGGALGARRFGAGWRGVLGASLGALIGCFFGLLGLAAGAFLGAVLLELAGGRKLREAGKAGLGATLGLALGAAGKLACALAMLAVFVADALQRG